MTARDDHKGPCMIPIGTACAHPCPECGSRWVLRRTDRRPGEHGLFYGCSAYPRCRVTHGAHADGEPLGVPADAETRRARVEAHAVFDKLWKGNGAPFDRRGAYRWIADAMNRDDVHISQLDARGCRRLGRRRSGRHRHVGRRRAFAHRVHHLHEHFIRGGRLRQHGSCRQLRVR